VGGKYLLDDTMPIGVFQADESRGRLLTNAAQVRDGRIPTDLHGCTAWRGDGWEVSPG